MRNHSKSIMILMLDLDPPVQISLFSCESASHLPETLVRFGIGLPHANTVRMNQQDPKSDICISTALSMTCREFQASIFNLQTNNHCGAQPTAPLHPGTSFPKAPISFFPPRILPGLTPPAPSSWIPLPFQNWE